MSRRGGAEGGPDGKAGGRAGRPGAARRDGGGAKGADAGGARGGGAGGRPRAGRVSPGAPATGGKRATAAGDKRRAAAPPRTGGRRAATAAPRAGAGGGPSARTAAATPPTGGKRPRGRPPRSTSDVGYDLPGRIIKRYSNRRFYDAQLSRCVTLEEIAELVRSGEEVRVLDGDSGEDLTRRVLTQIILEEPGRAHLDVLPIEFLRGLISLRGEGMMQWMERYLAAGAQWARRPLDLVSPTGTRDFQEQMVGLFAPWMRGAAGAARGGAEAGAAGRSAGDAPSKSAAHEGAASAGGASGRGSSRGGSPGAASSRTRRERAGVDGQRGGDAGGPGDGAGRAGAGAGGTDLRADVLEMQRLLADLTARLERR